MCSCDSRRLLFPRCPDRGSQSWDDTFYPREGVVPVTVTVGEPVGSSREWKDSMSTSRNPRATTSSRRSYRRYDGCDRSPTQDPWCVS